jgi:uncharacterized protein
MSYDAARQPHRAPAFVPGQDPSAHPRFRELTPAECVALLQRQHVGRIAHVLHGQVGIAPIHYVYDDGWIVGRTGPGTKLSALRHHPWVAFEVDEIDATFEWRSVVVRGAFYLLSRSGPLGARARWDHATELLRRLVPGALTPADPTPEREFVFRIHAGEVTGRAATTRPGPR